MSNVIGQTQEDLLEFYSKLTTDPWFFLNYVNTQDEVDKITPFKKFPIHLEYLHYYVRIWQASPFLLVPKSRRMKISWTTIALYTHEACFNLGRHFAFVSKKEEDADVLLDRAKFILDNLDKQIPRELIPRYEKTFCMLRFPEIDTKIEAFPSGADQLRQFTFSGIMGDEMAFWPDAQQMYKGAKPTLEGGGRMTLISSATPSFFEHLVNDTLDDNE